MSCKIFGKSFVLASLFVVGLMVVLPANTSQAYFPRGPWDGDRPTGGNASDILSELDASLVEDLENVGDGQIINELEQYGNADFDFDLDQQTLTVNRTYNEANVNVVIEAYLTEAGYGPVTVDLVPGAIVVTLVDFDYEGTYYGDVVITKSASAFNCGVNIDIVSVSVDGRNVPPAVLAEIEPAAEAAWQTFLETYDNPYDVSICINDITIGETQATTLITYTR